MGIEKKLIESPADRLNKRPKALPQNPARVEDLLGFIEVIYAAPTGIPKKFTDSIKIFNDSGTFYFYVYTGPDGGWLSTALT